MQLDGKSKAWIEEVGRSVGSENRHLRDIFKSIFSVASFHQVVLDIKTLPFVGKEACGEKGKPCAPTDYILRKNELNADFTFTGSAFSFHTKMNTWMNIFMQQSYFALVPTARWETGEVSVETDVSMRICILSVFSEACRKKVCW